MSTKKSPTTKKAAEKPSEQIVTAEVKMEPVIIPTPEPTKIEKARQVIAEDYGDIGLNQGFLLKAILTELVMRRI